MVNDRGMLTAWLPSIEEVSLDGGGGSKPVVEGFVRDFITNQVKKLILSRFNEIKDAFLKGNKDGLKPVIDFIKEQAKGLLGFEITDEQIAAVVEFALSLVSVKSDFPNAMKEFGELLISGSAFLSSKPLYATIAKQVGELLVAVAAELGKKSLLVGESKPDDRCGAAIEDFEAAFLVVGAKPDTEFGIIEVITIGRLVWELVAWWKRRRDEKKSQPQLLGSGSSGIDKGTVLFLKTSQPMTETAADKIIASVQPKVGVPVVVLWGGLEPEVIDIY